MKIDGLKDSFLSRTRDRIKNKFGDGFFTVFGICAFLFVMCGLFIGLLGRGWLYAWFLVFLGGAFALFPVVNHLLENSAIPEEVNIKQDKIKTRDTKDTENTSRTQTKKVNITKDRPINMDASKAAIELEAAIAKARLIKEKELERQRRAEQERYEADKAAYEARKEQIRKNQEEKRKKEENERKIREENAKKQKEFNENYFKRDNIKKASSSNNYFQGVTNSEELKKRYKDLLKIYHPDNSSGDAEITRQIHAQYKELVPFFKAYDRHKK